MPNNRSLATWLAGAAIVAVGACLNGDRIVEPPPPPSSLLASDPVATGCSPLQTISVKRGIPLSAATGSSEETPAYISLAPGTIPDGATVTISNARTTRVVTAAIIDGGFDPVPVQAIAGDTVKV